MGAAESNPVRNLDKRTARRQYRAAFSSAVSRYRVDDEAHHNSSNHGEQPTVIDDNRPVQCFIRKRPIFQRELKAFEFDVVTCGANRRRCTIHDARMKADMRNRLMTHHEFTFDRVFDENTTNGPTYCSQRVTPNKCLPVALPLKKTKYIYTYINESKYKYRRRRYSRRPSTSASPSSSVRRLDRRASVVVVRRRHASFVPVVSSSVVRCPSLSQQRGIFKVHRLRNEACFCSSCSF